MEIDTRIDLSEPLVSWLIPLERQNELRSQVVALDLEEASSLTGSDVSDQQTSSVGEQELVIRHYCTLINDICGEGEDLLNRRWRTRATAVVFFRRFYLRRSLLKYDPRDLMLACIFLAGKVEHDFIDIDKLLTQHEKGTVEGVLRMEYPLLEALQYDLHMNHAHNCVHGLVADMKLTLVYPMIERYQHDNDRCNSIRAEIRSWADAALTVVDTILVSGLYVALEPSLIAVHALLKTAYCQSVVNCEDYLRLKGGDFASQKLLELHNDMNRLVDSAAAPINRSEFKKAMKKLVKASKWGKS